MYGLCLLLLSQDRVSAQSTAQSLHDLANQLGDQLNHLFRKRSDLVVPQRVGTVIASDIQDGLVVRGQYGRGQEFETSLVITTRTAAACVKSLRAYVQSVTNYTLKSDSGYAMKNRVAFDQAAVRGKVLSAFLEAEDLGAGATSLRLVLQVPSGVGVLRQDVAVEFWHLLKAAARIDGQPVTAPAKRLSTNDSDGMKEVPAALRAVARLGIGARMEDDPSMGPTIMGNGDGKLQKGESFDLVVVITNSQSVLARSISCKLALPTDESIKSFSELEQGVTDLEPGASATLLYNLAMPLVANPTGPLVCRLVVSAAGDLSASLCDFVVPIDMQ